MLRVLVLSGLTVTFLVSVMAAAPQTPTGGPSPPYSKLLRRDMEPPPSVRILAPQPSAGGQTPRSKTVCGTVILVPDRVDPEMVKRPKDDVTYTIRRVPPPACSSR
jgi:hypothetical protein